MRRYGRVMAAFVAGVALSAAACGGDDSGEPPAATDAATTSEAPTTTEPATTTTGAAAGSTALDGSWVADAADLLAANTANVDGTGGLTCSGQVTMTFADGSLERSGRVTCSAAGFPLATTGAVSTTSEYSVDGDVLTVNGTASSGRATFGGADIPTPDSWGDGVATFRIEGDTLTIDFTDTAVGAVTQTYTRAE